MNYHSLKQDFGEYRMSCKRLWLDRHISEEYGEQNLLEYRTMSCGRLYREAIEDVPLHSESTVLWRDSEAMEISGVDTWLENRKNFAVKPKDIV